MLRRVVQLGLVGLALLSAARAQVIGLQPTPIGIYSWNPNTNQWQASTSTSTYEALGTTPQAYAFYSYNTTLGQWVPCTTVAACLNGSGVVTQLTAGNYVTISPSTGLGDVTVTGASITNNGAGLGVAYTAGTNLWTLTNTGVTQLVAGTGIGLSPSGGTGVVTVSATGGVPSPPLGSLQYNNAGGFGGSQGDWNTTNGYGFTLGGITAGNLSISGWSCDGTNCTLTAANSYIVGQPVQTTGTTFSNACMENSAVTPVLLAGLSSSQFEIAESATICSGSVSGTGGNTTSPATLTVNAGANSTDPTLGTGAINFNTSGAATTLGGGNINLTTGVTGCFSCEGSGSINLATAGNTHGGNNIGLSTSGSGLNGNNIEFTTSGNAGGGLNFVFTGNCLTGGCGTHENAAGFYVNLTSAGGGPGVNDATTTWTENSPDGASFGISLTNPGAGGAGGGAEFTVTTSTGFNAAYAGSAVFNLNNTHSGSGGGAFSVTATGPMSWTASNSSLTTGGALTVASCTGCVSGGPFLPLSGGALTGPVTSSSTIAPVSSANNLTLVFGDSLTAGGEDGSGITFPNALSAAAGLPMLNLGVGGQTSSQIAVRSNAYAGTASQQFAAGFTLPTSGTVTITFPAGFEPCYNVLGTYSDYYQGIPISFTVSGTTYSGYCTDNGSHVYSFHPYTYPASTVSVPSGTGYLSLYSTFNASSANGVVTQDIRSLMKGYVIIWAGRNNLTSPAQVEADIAAMVSTVKAAGGIPVILSVINAEGEPSGSTNYNDVIAINTSLSASYGANFIDVRSQQVAKYNPTNGADVLDHTNDIPPFSLRAQDMSGTVGAVSSTSTCAITFSNGAGTVGANSIVMLGSEYIYITGGSNGAWTCTRGYGGTTAATYISGTSYTGVDGTHWGYSGVSNANCGGNGYQCVATEVGSWIAGTSSPVITQASMGTSSASAGLLNASGPTPAWSRTASWDIPTSTTLGGCLFTAYTLIQPSGTNPVSFPCTNFPFYATLMINGPNIHNDAGFGGSDLLVADNGALRFSIFANGGIQTNEIISGFGASPLNVNYGLHLDQNTYSVGRSYPAWNLVGGGTSLPGGNVGQLYYSTQGGTIEAVTANLTGSITCATAPTIEIADCGTAVSCASPVSLTTLATGTSDGAFSATGLSVALAAGHYLAMQISAGSCTVNPSIAASVTLRER